MDFREQLTFVLNKKGIAVAEASRILDIPLKTIENWKGGTRKPSKLLAETIINILENHNFNFSYDYEDLLIELKEEIQDGMISISDEIQILRGYSRNGYKPILDWYYSKKIMLELLEDMSEEEISLYNKDVEKLITLKLDDVLNEMEKMDKII